MMPLESVSAPLVGLGPTVPSHAHLVGKKHSIFSLCVSLYNNSICLYMLKRPGDQCACCPSANSHRGYVSE